MNDHPSDADLRTWLAGDAGESESAAVGAHINWCPDCQGRLQALVQAEPLGGAGPAADGVANSRPAPGVLTKVKQTPNTIPWEGSSPLTRPLAGGDEPVPDLPGYAEFTKLAGGGMGVVYKARHVTLNRTVAVKVMRTAVAAREEDRERFRREAEAMARFNHERIVRVYDVGEHAGVPYFAMEYVEGGTLARRIGHHPLPPREAAALAAQIAYGLDHAHRGGVVHRDLKPANILLADAAGPRPGGSTREATAGATRDARESGNGSTPSAEVRLPCAKITDFGLARQLDGTPAHTVPGVVMGTPSYMAPEQARGESAAVDQRSDVYALGAVLYEMLTGNPPFNAPTAEQTRRLVAGDDDPPAVRTVQPGVPRDLETVCMKCLQKEPGRRYPDAQAVGRDLDNFLGGRPIVARPVGRAERLWKSVRRNPWASGALGLFVLAVAAGFAATAWQLRRVEAREADIRHYAGQLKAETEAAVRNMNLAVANQQRSNAYFRVANGAIHKFLLAESGEDRLEPGQVPNRLRRGPGADPLRRALFEKAETVFEQLLAHDTDTDTGAGVDLAARNDAQRTLATVLDNLAIHLELAGRAKEATERRDRALALREQLVERDPTAPDFRYGLALSHLNHGVWHRSQGSKGHAAALDALTRAVAAADALVAGNEPATDYRHLRSRAWANLGALHAAARRKAVADQAFARAAADLERLAEDAPHVFRYRHDLAAVLSIVADRSPPKDAEKAHRRAVAEWEKVVDAFRDEPDAKDELTTRLYVLGVWYRDIGRRPAEWEAAWKKSVELSEELVRDHPQTFRYAANLATAACNLGILNFGKNDHQECARLTGRAVSLLEKSPHGTGKIAQHDDPTWFFREALTFRADSLGELGRLDESLREWDRLLPITPPDRQTPARLFRAQTLARRGDATAAVTEVERVVAAGAAGENLGFAARAFAFAAAAAGREKSLSETARRALVEMYAGRGIALLNRAADEGVFKDPEVVKEFRQDAAWEPLRTRAGYKAFLNRIDPDKKP